MLGDLLGAQSLKRLGQKSWSQVVERIVPMLMSALLADHVVLGGGNSKKLKQLPAGVRLGNNLTAFRGGFRLWHLKDVPTLLIDDHHFYANQAPVK
jgi:polyphosphate glucokinase